MEIVAPILTTKNKEFYKLIELIFTFSAKYFDAFDNPSAHKEALLELAGERLAEKKRLAHYSLKDKRVSRQRLCLQEIAILERAEQTLANI